MAVRSDITPAMCAQFLRYDEASGLLFWRARDRGWFATQKAWRTWNTRFADQPAGGRLNDYRNVVILGVQFFAHRVVFAIKTGRWPEFVDHEDGDGSNNRWRNLREVDHQTNMKNRSLRKDNPSGVVGVKKHGRKWLAFITVDGNRITLGGFATFDEACAVRTDAAAANGFHANHGRPKKKAARKVPPPRRHYA